VHAADAGDEALARFLGARDEVGGVAGDVDGRAGVEDHEAVAGGALLLV